MKSSIGLGVDAPKEACEDVNCPWHGKLPVRGKVIEGKVVSSKSALTVIVERKYAHMIPKYQGYERRRTRLSVHNPPCMNARRGDRVLIAECRPISKTKSFVVVSKTKGE
ncbi:MAG: 30S ribosomal protein S17 [Candidatus Aenigmarchaeota archaeon]|nr:30S ribosomal protein S17 [Candidatus Aenigmarchaeota archaeon]